MGDKEVRNAIADIARALIGLNEEESWAVLDEVSSMLPRREWRVGDHCPHDGDPTDEIIVYIAAILFRHHQGTKDVASGQQLWRDISKAEAKQWVERAMKYINEIRPPWLP